MNKRVKTPTVIQMETTECGAACLAIVLGYFGRIVPLEEVRFECGVTRDGSKAVNIIRAACNYGLEAKGYRTEVEHLKEVPLPAILHWDFNHFVVLEGFRGKKVYLNDPATGPRTVTWDDVNGCFTGVAITLERGPAFRPGGRKRSMVEALGRRISGSGGTLVYIALVGLFLVIPGLVLPAFSKIFIDDIFIAGREDWLVPLLAGMAAAVLMQAGLSWLQEHYLLKWGTKMALEEASRFFWHVLRLPVEFFNQRHGAEIANRVAMNDEVASVISAQLTKLAVNAVMVVFYAGLMFLYNPTLTLVGLVLVGINGAVLQYLSRMRIDRSKRLICENGKLAAVSAGGLQSIESLKATGRESDFFARWADQQARQSNVQQGLSALTLVLGKFPVLLTALSGAVILAVGSLQIMEGSFTVGGLVAFQLLMSNLLQPFGQLVQLLATIQNLEGNMDRLDDVLDSGIDPSVARTAGGTEGFSVTAIKLSGALSLEGVTFGYSRLGEPLIHDFSVTLRPAERVAVVGASGSGKSTIAKLVMGLYQPWAGTIAIDGMPLDRIPRPLFSNSVGMVDQEVFLFDGTIKENLTLWDSTIPSADLVAAARDAAIHDDISVRPGGYEGKVEEMGANFSGGQRQRLEIARALVNNPSLLVLDEATSALDPATEKLIDDRLRRRGCACLIIAHRLSTIRDCDEIIVLEKGKVVQRGTHEEMKDVEGPYRRLIRGGGGEDDRPRSEAA